MVLWDYICSESSQGRQPPGPAGQRWNNSLQVKPWSSVSSWCLEEGGAQIGLPRVLCCSPVAAVCSMEIQSLGQDIAFGPYIPAQGVTSFSVHPFDFVINAFGEIKPVVIGSSCVTSAFSTLFLVESGYYSYNVNIPWTYCFRIIIDKLFGCKQFRRCSTSVVHTPCILSGLRENYFSMMEYWLLPSLMRWSPAEKSHMHDADVFLVTRGVMLVWHGSNSKIWAWWWMSGIQAAFFWAVVYHCSFLPAVPQPQCRAAVILPLGVWGSTWNLDCWTHIQGRYPLTACRGFFQICQE